MTVRFSYSCARSHTKGSPVDYAIKCLQHLPTPFPSISMDRTAADDLSITFIPSSSWPVSGSCPQTEPNRRLITVNFTGGTGITYALGHFLQVLNRAKSGRSAVRHLSLVWNVRDAGGFSPTSGCKKAKLMDGTDHLQWILPLLHDAFSTPVPANLVVEISIYTTSLSASSSVSSLNEEKEAEASGLSSSSDSEKIGVEQRTALPLRWFSGRADLTSVVAEVVSRAKGSRPVAVNGGLERKSAWSLIFS